MEIFLFTMFKYKKLLESFKNSEFYFTQDMLKLITVVNITRFKEL